MTLWCMIMDPVSYTHLQMTDEQYMRRAIELAKRGMGYTSPNPMVGAVIVKDGRIIGAVSYTHLDVYKRQL